MSSVAVTPIANPVFAASSVSDLRGRLESSLSEHLSSTLLLRERMAPPTVSTGIAAVDEVTGGLPRGALSELFGPTSSGRTSVMMAALAEATRRQEVCALVDASDSFDPVSAAAAGVNLDRLLWVRCNERLCTQQTRHEKLCAAQRPGAATSAGFAYSHVLEQVLKVTDLLLQSGGFGMVVLDLGDVPAESVRRIPLTSWFRFRRAVEPTATVLLLVEQESCAKTCASLVLRLQREVVCTADSSPGSFMAQQPVSRFFGSGQEVQEFFPHSSQTRSLVEEKADKNWKPTQDRLPHAARNNFVSHAVLLRRVHFQAEVVRIWMQRKPVQSIGAHFELRTAL